MQNLLLLYRYIRPINLRRKKIDWISCCLEIKLKDKHK